MLPTAIVAGGSFASALPSATSLDLEQRRQILHAAREAATNGYIARALEHFERDPSPIGRRPTGDRDWPTGLVGSVTHKGTLVLVAIASKAKFHAVGIDLERHLPHELRAIAADVAPEGLPPELPSDVATTIAFSAKEAAFKAQFPLTRRLLEFGDIELEWRRAAVPYSQMATKIADLCLTVDAMLVDVKWVVSSAQVIANM
jgi:4'-phosphopantetheinyl transferase EntD